jgi:ribosomal protein L32
MQSRNNVGRLSGNLMLLGIAVSLLVSLTSKVQATVLLKPSGQSAVALRSKTLDAKVSIQGAIATVQQELVFQNETSERIEADFYYTVPPGAVVNYFAYWFNGEKVVARIVEKERARAIYGYITAPPRQRDPALVELVGKNTFRARIFPVEPNADLKIEMKWVQPLMADGRNWLYGFPLKPAEAGKGTLDELKLQVDVRGGGSVAGGSVAGRSLQNNYNLPSQKTGATQRMVLQQRNFRAPRDFVVRIPRAASALDVDVSAARSGGSDGFFTLAVVPGRTLRRARWNLSGVKVYDVQPSSLTLLLANRVSLICGRYRGQGNVNLTLTGHDGRGKVRLMRALRFVNNVEKNNRGATLWAARKLENLSRRRDDNAIENTIELSTRFALPSRWTSWLAVPQVEMKRYWQENASADVNFYSTLLAKEIMAGRQTSRTAVRLRRQLDRVAKLAGYTSSKEALNSQFQSRISELAYAYANERMAVRPNQRRLAGFQRQLNAIEQATGMPTQEEVNAALQQYADPVAQRTARELVHARYSNEVQSQRARAARRSLQRLARTSGLSPQKYLQMAEEGRAREVLAKAGEELGQEVVEGRENSRRAQELRTYIDQTVKRRPQWKYYGNEWRQRRAYQARAHETAYQLAQEKARQKPDAQRLARLQDNLDDLAKQAGNTPEAYLEWEKQMLEANRPPTRAREYFMRPGDPLISIDAPRDAQSIVALLPGGEVKRLIWSDISRKWEARFDIPGYASEGQYLITVIIVAKDGVRRQMTLRYHVDVTAPHGDGRALLAGKTAAQSTSYGASDNSSKLRLELNASSDTTRVFALLPWGEKAELKPSSQKEHRFFALIQVPPAWTGKVEALTYVLTDKAHNRTSITVDVAR